MNEEGVPFKRGLSLRDVVAPERQHVLDALAKGDQDNLATYSDENANLILGLEYRYQRMVRLWGDTLQYNGTLHVDIRRSLNGATAQYTIFRTKGKHDMLRTYLDEFEEAIRCTYPGMASKENL